MHAATIPASAASDSEGCYRPTRAVQVFRPNDSSAAVAVLRDPCANAYNWPKPGLRTSIDTILPYQFLPGSICQLLFFQVKELCMKQNWVALFGNVDFSNNEIAFVPAPPTLVPEPTPPLELPLNFNGSICVTQDPQPGSITRQRQQRTIKS